VRVTIHHYNVHDLENIAHLLLNDLGLPGFSTNSVGYLGSCQKSSRELLLTTLDRETAMEKLLRLSERYQGRISAMAGPLAEARRWRKMEEACSEGSPQFPEGGCLTGCGCSSNKIAVRTDGTIIPCFMLAHIELGRINHDSLEEVWQSSPELKQLRERHTIELGSFEFCADCPYIPYCTGNCPGLAFALSEQVNHPSPDACLRRYLEDGGKLPEIRPQKLC
jgi:SynChlorMet cassette radical SAM/SPASM protein ScmE